MIVSYRAFSERLDLTTGRGGRVRCAPVRRTGAVGIVWRHFSQKASTGWPRLSQSDLAARVTSAPSCAAVKAPNWAAADPARLQCRGVMRYDEVPGG